MDKFVQNTETDTCTGQPILFGEPGLVMDYYDGNTVTGLWNYAQNYAMSDNNWDTTLRPVHARRAQPDLGPDRRRATRSTRRPGPRSRTRAASAR